MADVINVNEEEEMITLEFDDASTIDCYILGTFTFNEQEYLALEPDDDTDDIYIYEYTQVSDDEFIIEEIEDDDEFEAVADELDTLLINDDEDPGTDEEGDPDDAEGEEDKDD